MFTFYIYPKNALYNIQHACIGLCMPKLLLHSELVIVSQILVNLCSARRSIAVKHSLKKPFVSDSGPNSFFFIISPFRNFNKGFIPVS